MAERSVQIATDGPVLPGDLAVPVDPTGVVAFAHGSGSSRRSRRNRQVAATLQASGLATLLFDLLTDGEARDRRNVFDISLLGGRLAAATRWLDSQPDVAELPLGLFGASTGAAAALWAAAEPRADVRAVVSRGGRPDLAGERIPVVRAPTLLIVGSLDPVVLELNQEAQRAMQAPTELVVVPGATHLFEEPGTLEQVARLAVEWFRRYLVPPGRAA
jgi:putative phosphoribosyl transferase